MTDLTDRLDRLGVCREGVEWARGRTPADAWRDCPRGDWLMWLAGRLSGPPESASSRRVVRAAVACARLSLPYVREKDLLAVLLALHLADEYAAGREDWETACVAGDAAGAAAGDAARAARVAGDAGDAAWAAWAAGAAARAAGDAWDVAWAAGDATLARCADEVRRIIPHRVIARWARKEE